MYVSMTKMLQKANQENYAVLAINCFNLETAQGVIQAAEKHRAPIIIDLLEEHLKSHLSYDYLTQPLIHMAQKASVPVAINLDHGQDVAFVKQCLHAGFSSVMMDASMYPLEENIRITKGMVAFAQTYGASVEAEVGNMGAVSNKQWTNQQMYTNPDEAITFIEATAVDCLAVSYVSSHGDYPAGYQPAFDFEIVKKIKQTTHVPLVLHGGSGAGSENIQRSIACGINKINIGSDFMKGQLQGIKKDLLENGIVDYPELVHRSIAAGQEVVENYLALSGSKNKA